MLTKPEPVKYNYFMHIGGTLVLIYVHFRLKPVLRFDERKITARKVLRLHKYVSERNISLLLLKLCAAQ